MQVPWVGSGAGFTSLSDEALYDLICSDKTLFDLICSWDVNKNTYIQNVKGHDATGVCFDILYCI